MTNFSMSNDQRKILIRSLPLVIGAWTLVISPAEFRLRYFDRLCGLDSGFSVEAFRRALPSRDLRRTFPYRSGSPDR